MVEASGSEAFAPKVEPVRYPTRAELRRAQSRSRAVKWVLEIAIVLVGATLIALLLRMFVVQVYQIPSSSMEDTLQVGSRIAVNRLPGLGTDVERGDVVVFEDSLGWLGDVDPESESPLRPVAEFLGLVPKDGSQVVVKRVIGVGGDTVACCDAEGRLTVNGAPIDETYVKGPLGSSGEFSVVIPEDSLWVMGDNRSNSADSLYHYSHGTPAFVSEDSVIGRAWAEIWPFDRWSTLGARDVFSEVPEP